MNWHDKNTHTGQLVASQTTNGDFKDVHIVTSIEGNWSLVSLQDGYSHTTKPKDELIKFLNEHRYVPVVKMIGGGRLPEDRAGIPMVQIIGLRHSP